jgi:hypothetical protein
VEGEIPGKKKKKKKKSKNGDDDGTSMVVDEQCELLPELDILHSN